MNYLFVFVMTLLLPLMSVANGDSGWAERGNGKGFAPPPECSQGIVDPRQPIRPVTDTDIIRGGNTPIDPSCLNTGNLIGSGQPKINN